MTITLERLIAALEGITDHSQAVTLRGGNPGQFASWRGRYDELTITHGGPPMTVANMLNAARNAVGATFEGYKGGDYRMTGGTPVWADDWGCYTQTAIDGVGLDGKGVFLITRQDDGE